MLRQKRVTEGIGENLLSRDFMGLECPLHGLDVTEGEQPLVWGFSAYVWLRGAGQGDGQC